MNPITTSLLSDLMFCIPLYVVYAVGIGLAFAFRRRLRMPCVLTALALGVMFAANVAFHILMIAWIDGMEGDEMISLHQMASFCWNCADAVAIGLLLVAIFHGRFKTAADDESLGDITEQLPEATRESIQSLGNL